MSKNVPKLSYARFGSRAEPWEAIARQVRSRREMSSERPTHNKAGLLITKLDLSLNCWPGTDQTCFQNLAGGPRAIRGPPLSDQSFQPAAFRLDLSLRRRCSSWQRTAPRFCGVVHQRVVVIAERLTAPDVILMSGPADRNLPAPWLSTLCALDRVGDDRHWPIVLAKQVVRPPSATHRLRIAVFPRVSRLVAALRLGDASASTVANVFLMRWCNHSKLFCLDLSAASALLCSYQTRLRQPDLSERSCPLLEQHAKAWSVFCRQDNRMSLFVLPKSQTSLCNGISSRP